MYPWIVFLHMVFVFGFLLAHGISAGVILQLRNENEPERMKALLDLSGQSARTMYISLLLLIITGIIAGVSGQWWGQQWIWLSLVVLILVFVGMQVRGSGYLLQLRKTIGAQYFENMKLHPALAPASKEEIAALLASSRGRAMELLGMGGIGLLVILWLMILKPF
jgi:hypothetical protein